MSTYLIDFENVKSAGLNGIDRIAASDSVHLFWSARENKISIEMMELIRKSASEIEMHKASIGERDALDHQLCSYLGYLAGQAKDDSFVIISNDKAYDHLIEFWKELRSDIKIVRVPEIAKVSLPAAKALANASKNAENVVKAETSENSRESEASKPVAAESEQPANENNKRKRERSKTENGGRRGRNRFDKRRNSEELTEANQETAAEDATILERKDKQDFAVKTNPEQEALKQEENEQKTQNSDQIAVDDKAETKADDVKAEKLSSAEKSEKTVRETEKETEKEAVNEAVKEAVNETVKEESSKEASVKEMGEDSPSQTEKEKANIAESSFWGTPKETEEETIKKPVSVVSVVSRIVTGIVRESGYTANGIMDGYKVQEEENREAVSEAAEAYEKAEEVFAGKEEITAEPLTENASEQATEAAGETVTVSEAAVTEGADETAKEADEAVSVTAAVTEGADETVKEDGEAAEAADAVTEAADEAVKAAEEADEAAEVTESEAAVTEAADEAVKTAEEADAAAEEAKEAETDETAGEAFVAKDEVSVLESKTEDTEEVKEAKAETKKPARSRSRKPAKKAEEKEASEEEKPAKPDKKSRTPKTAKKAKTESGEAVKSEKQEGQKKETAKKKTTKTAVKAPAEILVSEGKEAEEVKPVRASKVKKAADSEKLTESAKKSPVTEADVLSKFPEAEGKEWLSQIVAAINESVDRRIMYGMIVKVLGQEYGRSVYHAIKSLK